MIRTLVLLALLFGGIAAVTPAPAADTGAGAQIWRSGSPGRALPFPRDARAQSVWADGACWSDCQSFCTWGEAACLQQDAQGRCLTFTDRCDRTCQRECRTRGGPLLPDIFDF